VLNLASMELIIPHPTRNLEIVAEDSGLSAAPFKLSAFGGAHDDEPEGQSLIL
jgi:hypothetical protein